MASKSSAITGAERTALVLQGLVAIMFGILAVFWPGLTTLALVYLFAAFLLVDGMIVLVWGLSKIRYFGVSMLVTLFGVIELGIGLYLLRRPEVALETLIWALGLVLIFRGLFSFFHLVHTFIGKRSTAVKSMHALLSLLGVAVGVFILFQPVASGLAFVWAIGLYSLVAGAVMIALSSSLSKK